MYNRGKRRKITMIDKLRGWHWNGTDKVRNWCGCII